MSERARIYVEGYELDLGKETNIPLNLQVVDIKELNKRVGDFTKTISVPGTKRNNKILGNAFNLQIEYEDTQLPNIKQNFNPKRKARTILESNNIAFSEGYIQLRNIRKNNGRVWYDLVFYGRLADIVSDVAGKQVDELDFSDLNHTLSISEVTGSWDGTGDFIYPYVDYGHANIRSHGEVNIGHLKPAIKLKRYIDQIFDESGFTYDAPFFETTDFNKLYIPYNGVEDNVLTEDEEEALSGVGTNDNSTGVPYRFEIQGNDEANANEERWLTNIDVLGEGNILTSVFLAPEILYTFQVPETRIYDLSVSLPVSLDSLYYGTNTDDQTATYEHASHFWRPFIRINDSNGVDVTTQRQFDQATRKFTDVTEGDFTNELGTSNDLPSIQDPWIKISGGDNPGEMKTAKTQKTWTDWTPSKELDLIFDIERINLQQGDTIQIWQTWYAPWADAAGIGSSYGRRIFTFDGSLFDTAWGARVRVKPESNLTVVPTTGQITDTTITYDQFVLSEVQQKDLFLSTLKLFNLVAVPDSENPRNLLIRERDDFFASGSILNWDDKIDQSKNQDIQPVRDPEVRRWIYTWAEGTDFYSNLYRDLTDREYGEVRISNNSEFGKDDKQNVDIIYEPLINVKYEDNKVFGIVGTFPRFVDKTIFRASNVDDIREITGVGQSVTVVVDGIPYDRVIERLTETDLYFDSEVGQAVANTQYGIIIKNKYDRLSVISYKGKDDNIGQDPVETNPKLAYFSGLKSSNQYNLTDVVNIIPKTEYPVLSHLNAHPDDNPTFDYNFGQPQRVFFSINNYPQDNIYTKHHEQTLQEILDGSNVVTTYINSSDIEIVNLKYNDKIYIEGQLYRINKVIDFNLNKNQTTKIELIKL